MKRESLFSGRSLFILFLIAGVAVVPLLFVGSAFGSTWASVSAGNDHAAGIGLDGKLWTWGRNDFGQLGDGTKTHKNYPVLVSNDTWLAVSAGAFHTTAIKTDGTVWTWGRNDHGELGRASGETCGSAPCSTSPAQVGGLSGVTAVASGWNFTMALTAGNVYSWGDNFYGQLGRTSGETCVADGQSRPCSTSPGQVSLSNVVQIVAGGEHAVVLSMVGNDSVVYAWGRNDDGAIGNGTENNSIFTPTVPTGLPVNTVQVAAGAHFSLARTNSNLLYAWGSNWQGQLGLGDTTLRLIPVQVNVVDRLGRTYGVIDVVGGGDHTVVRTDAAVLFSWGRNDYGQLGVGPDAGQICSGLNCSRSPLLVTHVIQGNWTSISSRGFHTMALGSGGMSLWATGLNNFGQFGDGTNYSTSYFHNVDWDNDGTVNGIDNCSYDYNPDQADLDADGDGDVCDADMDNDGVMDKMCGEVSCDPIPVASGGDNCPSVFNPLQEDQDGDSVGDVCDNCPKVSNPMVGCGDFDCQPDNNGNGVGDACEYFSESGQFAGGATSMTINVGEPAFASATLCNNTNAAIQTIRPEWPFNMVPELYGPDGSLLPISCHFRAPFDVPGDVITMAAGECLTVTGDVSLSYAPEVISMCNPCTLKTLYFNTIQDPLYGACPLDEQCYNLPLVMVRSTAASTLTVNTPSSGPVQRNDAQVTFAPSEWDVKWATENSPGISASISNIAGGHSAGQIVPGSIRLNGTVPGSLIIVNGAATVLFDRAAAVRSLGTPVPGTTVFPTVHGSLNDGSLFYGQGSVNIVNKPLSPANLMIQGHTMRVGAGKTPPVTKDPIGNMEIRVYPMSAGSCAAGKGISWQNYPAIWSGCQPSAFGWAGATSGEVGLSVAPGEYLAIGQFTTAGTTVYPGTTVGKVSTGLKTALIKIMLTANGSVLTGKYSVYPGSQLILIEPEYVEWTGTEELYPFVFESVGDWDVTTAVSPPEGFVADFPELSAVVNTDLKAVQFTITDVGSEWVSTKVKHKIKHKGKTIEVNNKIGLKLAPGLQKKLGLGEFGEETNKK